MFAFLETALCACLTTVPNGMPNIWTLREEKMGDWITKGVLYLVGGMSVAFCAVLTYFTLFRAGYLVKAAREDVHFNSTAKNVEKLI